MKSIHTQKGFTLVELAIVMTIIGLLIGGILKGQELMENARVTSTVAQVKSYEAAVTTFRDSYNAVPGDIANAEDRIPGCVEACNAAAVGAGDGIVGDIGWATDDYAAQVTAAMDGATPSTVEQETQLFWVHLLKADLIAGVTDAPIRTAGGVFGWGESHPAARIGGGFVVGQGNGTTAPGAVTASTSTGISGMVLVLQTAPGVDPAVTAGTQPMTPARAAQIDRRIDDGRPNSGYVHGYGLTASCYNDANDTRYAEAVTSKDCGLVMRIQG